MVASAGHTPSRCGISIKGLEAMIEEYKAWGKIPNDFDKEHVLRLNFLQAAVSELDTAYGAEGY